MGDIKVKYVNGLQFLASTAGGHEICMDAPREFGGSESGPTPMELLLAGLGGCSGMDIVSLLKKKKQNVQGIEIRVTGRRAEAHPKHYTDIDIEFLVTGTGLSEEALRRAVELSMEKYCSVKATIGGTARVNYSYKIVNRD